MVIVQFQYQADIFSNEPVDFEEFELTSEKWHCKGCNFKELCMQ